VRSPLLPPAFHAWRLKNDIPLRQVARDLGLAVATINAWELGGRFPTGSHFEMIANYTGVPSCKLFCRKADKCVRADCLVMMGRKASTKVGTCNKRRQ
jgi:transcriptional regulator with XRE-family HTH domain